MADDPTRSPGDAAGPGNAQPGDGPGGARPGDGPGGDGPRDLLAAYALDAVDDLERRSVDRLLDTDAAARAELDGYRETVAAFTVDRTPPAALRDAVLAEVARRPRDARRHGDVRLPAAEPRRRMSRRVASLGIAAAVVAAVAVPTGIAVQARHEQQQLRVEADRIARMLADPDAVLVTGAVQGGGDASALVADGGVLFATTGLDRAAAGHDYQLWVVDGDSISSAGLVTPREGSSTTVVSTRPGVVLAITVEPAGGSDQPTGDPIVALQI